jgi:YYY domain-containing protein
MKKIAYSMIAVILFFIGKWMLRGDYIPFLQWWAVVAGIGIIFFPLTTILFANFHDRGYLFSKAIGIAVTGYLMWLFSSLHLMKFTTTSSILCIVISLVLNGVLLFWKNRKRTSPVDYTSIFGKEGVFDTIIVEELMFFAVFLLLTYIRCFKPEAYGTEKFMDYGFMTSMMRSDYMPPQDFWFSGTKLNYYYVGQYLAAYLTRVSFVEVSDSYNLMLMMVGAFTFVLPYSIIYNVTRRFLTDQEKKSRYLPALSGLLAGGGVCIAGNMHYPTFKWLEPAVRKFFGMEASETKYWFPDATRFIGYHPETSDKTIHEFPAYSFVLGDLHAHVINIFFVLTVLGLLFSWLSTRDSIKEQHPTVIREIFHPAIIAITFFIGLFHTTNFWDFPIYFVVTGGIILFSNLIVYNFKSKALWLTVLQGIFVFAASSLVCLPFTLNFDQISTNICLTVARTPFNQMIILWGLPVFVVVCFIVALVSNHKGIGKSKGVDKETELENKDVVKHKERQPVLFHFLAAMRLSDLYILVLGLCAIGLILIPEVIYVEDIYSGDYKRANTMFKLTYQAFIMFGLCFGYILLRLLCYGRTHRQKWLSGIGLALFLISITYCQNAVNSWYGNIFDRSGYKGLDATAFMENTMPDDDLAIRWLNENARGVQVVLEANGDSYTDYQRVSVMTGLVSPLGWRSHEWLWKGDPSLLDARALDIETIYTSFDEEEVLALIDKYNISYIYVGKLEQEKYETINHDLLKKLGNVVFSSPTTQDKSYETYIVQLNY